MTTTGQQASEVDVSAANLANELRDWFEQEVADWDEKVMKDDSGQASSDTSLWDDMPEVDSKVVARTSPIFERHLGIPLDVNLIRPGGYSSIDDVLSELIPLMIGIATQENQKTNAG